MAAESLTGEALTTRVIRLGRALQAKGIAVAPAEVMDASQAALAVGLSSRDRLRVALRATMIKHERHLMAFDHAFDRLFPARPAGARSGTTPELDDAAAAARLSSGDDLTELASELVQQHAGLEGELRSEGHHLQRAYRGADLARLMSEARRLDTELTSAEVRARIEDLKALMAAEIRGSLGDTDDEIIDPATEDIEFLQASRAELADIRETVAPLARRLASRIERRRQRAHRGTINIRRTARRSVATGGVPVELSLHRRRPHRPELFVLCDISGSVADFSLFTLTFMSAISSELARTRSFVFVDAIDEITELLAATDHGIEPWQIMRNTNVIGDHGHSDYGAVLRQFWTDVADSELRSTATVLICGDARTNHRASESLILERIASRARHVYWLNPEPEDEWDTHDSEMAEYGSHCTEVFEVRNLRQLARCVENIL